MANSVTEWLAESALRLTPDRGPAVGGEFVREAIAAKKYNPLHLNLTELAQTCLGKHTYESRLRDWGKRAGWVGEATEATDLSAFRSVMAANVAAVMDQPYQDADSVTDQLFGTEPDEAGMDPLAPIRHPVGGVATDQPKDKAPAAEYARTGFGPGYIDTPIPDMVGLVAVMTLEWVKANRWRRFVNEAREVKRKVLIERRKRRLRVALGITNNYKRNGTGYNTFLTSGDRVNRLTDLVLTTATAPDEVDRLLQLFDSMTNPFTGEPMDDFTPTALLTVRGNRLTLAKALGTQLVRVVSGTQEYETPAPVEFNGTILSDRYVYNMLVAERGLTAAQAKTYVQVGDFQAAYKVREVEPFTDAEVGPDDPAWPPAFFQEVVYAVKSRFWEVPYVADPFRVAEAYNSAAT